MFEVAMAAFRTHFSPAVLFKQLDHFPDAHQHDKLKNHSRQAAKPAKKNFAAWREISTSPTALSTA
jgi:hypothetical protein